MRSRSFVSYFLWEVLERNFEARTLVTAPGLIAKSLRRWAFDLKCLMKLSSRWQCTAGPKVWQSKLENIPLLNPRRLQASSRFCARFSQRSRVSVLVETLAPVGKLSRELDWEGSTVLAVSLDCAPDSLARFILEACFEAFTPEDFFFEVLCLARVLGGLF